AEGAPAAGDGDDEDEDADAPGAAATVPGWIRLGDDWHPIGWQRNGLFRVTDAAALPDGDLIVLERRFTRIGGPAARLSLVPRAQIRPQAVLIGQELAVLHLPQSVDNFEALAVRAAGDGSVLIYILS